MITHTIRCALLAIALGAGAAQAAFLDGEALAFEEGAASGPGEFETIAGSVGDGGFEEEPRFAITCWDCEGVGEGDFVITDAEEAVAPVPLPAGGALLLGGLAALGWVRRRR